MSPKMRPELSLHDLSLQVHLGCTAQERLTPQEVRVSVDIRFSEPPPGETSDQLEHTICYAKVCESLKKTIALKTFNLIEKIAAESFKNLKAQMPSAEFKVKVFKVHPPVEGLQGGVTYLCGDLWT